MRTADALRLDLEQTGEDPSRCSASLERMARDLDRCLEWLRRGAIREAATYNVDAGNIVALALDLHRRPEWTDALASARMPSSDELDSLARAHATAGAHASKVQAWQDACAAGAPITEQMAALQAIRACEPEESNWTELLDELSSVALAQWAPQAQAALDSGEPAELSEVRRAIIDMGIRSDEGRRLIQQLDDAIEACRLEVAQTELEQIAGEMHLAWAAMDTARGAALRPRLVDVCTQADDQAAARLGLAPMLAWLDRCDEAQAAQARRQAQIDDLQRALDEDRDIAEIERRYAVVRSLPGPIEPVLESRAAHRFQTHRRRQRRMFALAITVIVALAVALTAAVTIATNNARHQARVRDLVHRIETELKHGHLASAQTTWGEVEEAGLAGEPLLAAIHTDVEAAARDHAARRQRIGALVDQALELMDAPEVTLESMDDITAVLAQARQEAPRPMPHVILQLDERRREMLTALLSDERTRLQTALAELDQQSAAPEPAGGDRLDRQAWRQWADPAHHTRDALAVLRASRVAGDADIAAWMDRIDETATQQREHAARRIGAIDEIEGAMRQLSRTPTGERAWADTWSSLVDGHIGMLQIALPQDEWMSARDAAQAARAVAHWRDTVRPALTVAAGGQGLMPGTPRAAADAISVLGAHEASYAGSPYAGVASELRNIARQARTGLPPERAAALIEASGLLDLYFVALNAGGRAYVRTPDAGSLRVVASRADLSTLPDALDDSVLGRDVAAVAAPEASPASAALARGLRAVTVSDPRGALMQSLSIPAAVEAASEQDTLLHLEALIVAWRTVVETQGAAAAGGLATVEAWLDDLPTLASSAVQADWPRFARSPDPSAQRSLRRHAGRALMAAPTVASVTAAIQHTLERQDAAAAARAPAAVLLREDDAMRVHDRTGPSEHALEMLRRTGQAWVFSVISIDVQDGLVSDDGNLPRTPTLLFAR